MGLINSKSPLERRNTVLRRSQRKSIFGIKGKTDKLIKDIKKFKGAEDNTAYIELKARIAALERDLKNSAKNLQPQLKPFYNETLKKTEDCYKLLQDKLNENQAKEIDKNNKEETSEDNDDVFVEEIADRQEEERALEETTNKRKTVELTLVQVEPIETSPQFNKRASLIKHGVPVMPGSIMEAFHKKTQNLNSGVEEKVSEIRKKIENLEIEISQFVGKKNGRYYNKIKEQLGGYLNDLQNLPFVDDEIKEQVNLCRNYVINCLSFLNEKAVDDETDSDEDELENVSQHDSRISENFSPRSIRTTYI